MIDSIFTAMTGLQGHQKGLKVISNNVANMNTAGFKSSTVGFTDVFMSNGKATPQADAGSGLNADRTQLNLASGSVQETGRDTDLAIDGKAFFVLADDDGQRFYSRAGSFSFDGNGNLRNEAGTLKVLARDAGGALAGFQVDFSKVSPPKVTSKVSLNGNLSSTDDDHTIDGLVIYDKAGGAHTLRLSLKPSTEVGANGKWTVNIFEGATNLGHSEFAFSLVGLPDPIASSFKLELELQGGQKQEVEFTLDSSATSFSSGTTSTLAIKEQDGHGAGKISTRSFDETGRLKITYTNGEKEDGPTLAFAELNEDDLVATGNATFKTQPGKNVLYRGAGEGLKLIGKSLELSNVDLTSEFSNLILMQRGYQASSQVLTTANEMLQQLFELRGRR